MQQHTPRGGQTPLFIHGLGPAGPFGFGTTALHNALQAEALPASARREVHLPAPECSGGLRSHELLMTDLAPLEQFVPKRGLRRLDRFSRLALSGAHLALQDAGLPPAACRDAGLVVATGYGAAATTFAFLDGCFDDGDALASPTHFSHSVHNAAAANVAIQLGLQGPCCTVSQFETGFATALATARAWIAEGRVSTVLLGAVDEACDVLAYCQGHLCACTGPAALPGEGAAFFVLRAEPPEAGQLAFKDMEFTTGTPHLPAENCILDARLAAAHPRLLQGEPPRASYGHIYGITPCGQALDAAAALLFLHEGHFPAAPETGQTPLKQGAHICCATQGGDAGALLRIGPA